MRERPVATAATAEPAARHREALPTAIVEAAAQLLESGGPAAVTTRAVADRAGVQPPAIYRHFGDKDGLLAAVAEHVMAAMVAGKQQDLAGVVASDVDPVDDVRESWHRQVAFGLAHPAVFRLLSDPERFAGSPAAAAGREVLAARVRRLARAGLLGVREDRAAQMLQAACVGTVQVLLGVPADQRDPGLAEAMLGTVLAQVLTTPAGPSARSVGSTGHEHVALAVSLRARVEELSALSSAEQTMLGEWLDRLAQSPVSGVDGARG